MIQEKIILAIVSNMFNEKVEMNDEIKDAAGELCNMISGQARQKLDELGKAGIPSLITSKGQSIKHISDHRNTLKNGDAVIAQKAGLRLLADSLFI